MGVVLTDNLDKMLMLFLIVLPFGHGFLLDNPQGNAGQSLPANQYLTISKFVEEKNILQQKVETDTTSLRHDMDTSLALLAAQLQQKFDLMDAKITAKVTKNETNQEFITLQHKYQALENNYQTMMTANAILQQKFDLVESELLIMKNRTLTNDLFFMEQNNTTTRFSKQQQELAVLKNKSMTLDQEMLNLKQLSGIKPLQQVKYLEQELQTLSAKTNSLALQETARSQDFLALYNMTTHSFSDLEMRTDSKIQQLSISHNISFRNIKNRMYLLNNDTMQSHNSSMIYLERKLEIQLKNIEKNQSKALNEIASGMQETEKRTNLTLTRLQKQIDNSTELVAMTAQLTHSTSSVEIIRFDNVRFSVGISNLSLYNSTGKFTCERDGLYLISVSIFYNTNDAYYNIYLNDNLISQTAAGRNNQQPSVANTGSIVLSLQLQRNDTVWIKNVGNFYIYSGTWSTLTIVKVK